MMLPDLGRLLAHLETAGVGFVAIGGVAVGVHGYLRATEDLDIVPDTTPDNHERLALALAAINATLPTADGRTFDADSDLGALRRGHNVTADTDLGSLDIVQRVPGMPGYASLAAESLEVTAFGSPVRVCSLSHLRQMKSARRSSQDLADLDNLPES